MKIRSSFGYSLITLSAATTGAWAQASGEGAAKLGVLEEVVITAERREASAQESALSISVITGDDLIASGIGNTADLLDRVPGLDITHANITSNISLRGLSSGGSTQYTDPVVAFNVGGVPISRQYATSGAFYDLERVEVLKGPQGTLYGRNATVGALNVIPKRPDHEFGGNVSVDIGNYNAVRTTGAFNMPVSAHVAMRLAAATHRHDGYLTDGYDDADNQGARLSLLYEPNDDVSLLVRTDYYRDSSNGPSAVFRYVNPGQEWQVPGNPWFAFGASGCGTVALCPTWGDSAGAAFAAPFRGLSVVDDNGYVDLKQFIYSAELNWRTPVGTLTVLPSHVATKLESLSYGTGLTFWPKTDARQNALEARLASAGEGRLRWVVGAFYFREKADAWQRAFEPNGYQLIRTPNLIDESTAGFGEVTFSLIDSLRLTAGVRHTSEMKSQDGFTLLDGAFTTTTCPAPGTVVTGPTTAFGQLYPVGYCSVPNGGRLKFDDTSWKVGVEFDAAEQSLLYANVRTGFKAGGLAPALPPNTYKPEKLTAYEVGSKNRFFDNRLQANVEVFYWDYKDQQVSILHALTPAGQTAWPVNVDGWAQGVELSLTAAPVPNTRLGLDVLYEDGEYDLYPTVISSGGALGGLTDFRRINMPEWSGTLSAQQFFQLSNGGEIVFGADAHYESESLLRPVAPAVQRPGDFRDAFVTGNADLSYHAPDDAWTVGVYVKNVSNEAVVGTGSSGGLSSGVFYRPPTNAADARYATLQPPRTYGLRITAKF